MGSTVHVLHRHKTPTTPPTPLERDAGALQWQSAGFEPLTVNAQASLWIFIALTTSTPKQSRDGSAAKLLEST